MIHIYIAYCRHYGSSHLTNSTGSPEVNNLSKSITTEVDNFTSLAVAALFERKKRAVIHVFLQIILFKSSAFYVDMKVMQ